MYKRSFIKSEYLNIAYLFLHKINTLPRDSSLFKVFDGCDTEPGESMLHLLNLVKADCVWAILFLNATKLRTRLSHGLQISFANSGLSGSISPLIRWAKRRISLFFSLNKLYLWAGSPTDLHSPQVLLLSKLRTPYNFFGVFFSIQEHLLLRAVLIIKLRVFSVNAPISSAFHCKYFSLKSQDLTRWNTIYLQLEYELYLSHPSLMLLFDYFPYFGRHVTSLDQGSFVAGGHRERR